MKTIVTIKIVPESQEDLQVDVPKYIEDIRQMLIDQIDDVQVRSIVDFEAIKKGEPPIVVDHDEELALHTSEELDHGMEH